MPEKQTARDKAGYKSLMQLSLYQVDAFAERLFAGNPAAIVPLGAWLPDERMLAIAAENNLSETAFFVPEGDYFRLRWFTPKKEIDLCGHATLATASVLFEQLGYPHPEIRFRTRSGALSVARNGDGFTMLFPAVPVASVEAPGAILEGLRAQSPAVFAGRNYMAVFETEDEIRNLDPDFAKLATLDLHSVIATAPGRDADFVSRYFAPKSGVNEDPVTGSAHCELTPFCSARLGKTSLRAQQLSARGGSLQCELRGEQVALTGKAQHYMTATITIP